MNVATKLAERMKPVTEPDPSPEALELAERLHEYDAISVEGAARLIDAWAAKRHESCVHCGDPMGRGDDACWSCYSTQASRADFAEERAEAAEARALTPVLDRYRALLERVQAVIAIRHAWMAQEIREALRDEEPR